MSTCWLLVADAGRARIFEIDSASHACDEVEDCISAEAQLPEHLLAPGVMGQIVGGPAGRLHVISARTPLHDVIAAQFARGLVDDLVEAHDDGRFQQLDIVAPPRFLGLIRQTLPLSLASHVGLELDKDWVHLPASDVARRYEAVKLHR